jgi:hypothetical protein
MQIQRRFPCVSAGCVLAAFWFTVLLAGTVAAAAGKVPLTVAERLGVDRTAEPITSGVPLPKGAVTEVGQCRLLADGRAVPAQFRAAGLWRPGRSIRWLLVDCQADVAANGKRAFTLEYGDGAKAPAPPKSPLRVQQDADGFTVHTGAATFRVSRKRFSLFEQVTLAERGVLVAAPGDKPRAGAVIGGLRPMVTRAIPSAKNTGGGHLIYVKNLGDAAEQFTLSFVSDREYELVGSRSGPVGRGTWRQDFTSTNNAIGIPTDAWLNGQRPKKGDVFTFRAVAAGSTARSDRVSSAEVIESGPMRVVLRVRGAFVLDADSSAPAMEFTAWYHFHAGSARVRLQFTLENNGFGGRTNSGNARNCRIGGVNCVFFDRMALELPLAIERPADVWLGGDAAAKPVKGDLQGTVELYQDSNGGEHWARYKDPKYNPRPNSYVTFKGYKVYRDGKPVAEGGRALGWMSVCAKDRGLTVAVKDFWQQFPKGVSAAGDGTVRIELFPARYAGDYPFRSGEHKTHEVLFHFHTAAALPDRGEAVARAFNEPLRLEPGPQWFATTRVLGGLHPFDVAGYRAYEVRNLSAIGVFGEGVRKGPSILSRREQHDFYGWMDYGDVSMDFENASGQWGMKYDLDLQFARQWARSGNPRWWRLFAAAVRHHCDIDVHHQPHYAWSHYVKGGSWAHSLHGEAGHRNPNRNYNRFTKDLCFGALGAAALHYLTGDWKAHDNCLEQAENALARYMSVQQDPGQTRNRMGGRGDAGTLNRLMAGYVLAGDPRFLERARWTIRDCRFDGRPAKHGATSLWASAFYMVALARYLEHFPEDADARKWFLAHVETLHASCHEKNGEFQGMYYTITPKPDGTIAGRGTTSHYNILAADVLSIGYRLTGEKKYMDMARRCFAYGVKHACWKNGPPTYYHIHSGNGGTHGGFFMAEDAKLRAEGK